MNFKDFVNRMQRKGNVKLLDVFFWMKLILIFSLSVLHLYYEIKIVNRSNNVLMSLIDVLISVFSCVEFVVDRMVSVVLVFMWLYVYLYIYLRRFMFVLIIMAITWNCYSGIICSFSSVFKCFRSQNYLLRFSCVAIFASHTFILNIWIPNLEID